MKTIKVIDLLNKIANGEEVPEKIKYLEIDYSFQHSCSEYVNEYGTTLIKKLSSKSLNHEVEIIEDTPKEYINVSEEQVLFNNLSYEEQQFILKQMRMLQPCKLENNRE